jgi:hypothetical protein
LQRLLRNQIEVISPETLIVSEEFGEWEESKRRIDLPTDGTAFSQPAISPGLQPEEPASEVGNLARIGPPHLRRYRKAANLLRSPRPQCVGTDREYGEKRQ